MHEMQSVVTDDRGVCQFVCHTASLCGGHSMQPLLNHFGLLLVFEANVSFNMPRDRFAFLLRVCEI